MVVNCKGNPRLFQGNLGEGEIFFSIWPDGTGIFAYIYDRFRWNVGGNYHTWSIWDKIQDPWDERYIHLHEWLILMGSISR